MRKPAAKKLKIDPTLSTPAAGGGGGGGSGDGAGDDGGGGGAANGGGDAVKTEAEEEMPAVADPGLMVRRCGGVAPLLGSSFCLDWGASMFVCLFWVRVCWRLLSVFVVSMGLFWGLWLCLWMMFVCGGAFAWSILDRGIVRRMFHGAPVLCLSGSAM